MYFWANEIVSRIGISKSATLILAIAICAVHLVIPRRRRPAILRWSVWIPLLFSLYAVYGGLAEARETYFYLHQRDAITAPQREVLFSEARKNAFQQFSLGVGCSVALWGLFRPVKRTKPLTHEQDAAGEPPPS